MMLSDVCLSVCLTSVAYIGLKSRTERPRKTRIGTEVHTWLGHHFQGQKVTRPLYSPRHQRVRQLQRWAWERTERGNLLLRCRLQARSARRREALRRPQREERSGGILWRPPAYSLLYLASAGDIVLWCIGMIPMISHNIVLYTSMDDTDTATHTHTHTSTQMLKQLHGVRWFIPHTSSPAAIRR